MNAEAFYAPVVRRLLAPWSWLLAHSNPRHVYIGLALVLAAWIVLSTLTAREHHVKNSTYDWMLTHRFRVAPPDPAIVLLDIDERSLAAMANDYGRWPWPRDVLATVLAGLEAQGATAVVFDILFSDADRQNPVSDRAFADAVARSRVAYFPVLRLNPANDGRSAVHADQLPGLVVAPANTPGAAGSRTLAVVLPFFDTALASGRLGTHNVDPDPDSLIRRFRLWEDVAGVRILSLPARMAREYGWPLPATPSNLLQFNSKVMAYTTVSFADVFTDMLRKNPQRDTREFRGRIVLIGSTAPGLFDLKGTPVSRTDPGLDILATAIDNTKNGRFFRELSPLTDGVLAALLLGVMLWLCLRYSHEQLRLAFLVAPGLLLVVSYLSMNLSNLFIDLTAPASMAFLYFSAVKFYSSQVRKRWAGDAEFAPVNEAGVDQWIGCLAARVRPYDRVPGFESHYLNLLRTHAPGAHVVPAFGTNAGWLSRAYAGTLVATWVERADDGAAIARARTQATALREGLGTLVRRGVTVAHDFGEEVVAVDRTAHTGAGGSAQGTQDAAPRPLQDVYPGTLLDHARQLVTRTVLQLTQGTRA